MKRILALVLTMALCLALLPLTASAATETVFIGDLAVGVPDDTTKANIQSAIDKVSAAGGGTVTVTGARYIVGKTLSLTIPAGVTVEWKAGYTNQSGSFPNSVLISLTGAGIFEVAANAYIACQSSAGLNTTAIDAGSTRVKVSGGRVQARNGTAIKATSDVTLTGGAISAEAGTAIEGHDIRVNSGSAVTVGVTGTKPAIKATYGVIVENGDLTVRGDIVSGSAGIDAFTDATVRVYGDIIADYLGIAAQDRATAYLVGTITAFREMEIEGVLHTVGAPTMADALELDGYRWDEYTKDGSYVYIRRAAIPYTLTVVNGAANAGQYCVGDLVSITANPPPAGQAFDGWTTDDGGMFYDPYNAATTFVMPPNAATVTAAYATIINIPAILGVTPPVPWGTPVTEITETAQYTGTVTWIEGDGEGDGAMSAYKAPYIAAMSGEGDPPVFGYGTVYTAKITLEPKPGYTLAGVQANFFAVAGAAAVSNLADDSEIRARFPATGALLWGDADENGEVNAADAAAILRFLVELRPLTENGKYQARVTGGANVSAADAARILRWLVELVKDLKA